MLPPDLRNTILAAVTQWAEHRRTDRVAALKHQPGSTPGQHGVSFVGNTGNPESSTFARGVAGGTTQPSKLSTINEGDAPSAFQMSSNATPKDTLRQDLHAWYAPAKDALRRDIYAWLRHSNICFAFACAGPFSTHNARSPMMNPIWRQGTILFYTRKREVAPLAIAPPRQQRKLYALFNEQLEVPAAVGGYDVEDIEQEDKIAEF